jgi:hypothetical protein
MYNLNNNLNIVDFPEPLFPTMAVNDLEGILKLTSFITSCFS